MLEDREARRVVEQLREGSYCSYRFLDREWTLHFDGGHYFQTVFLAGERDNVRVLDADETLGLLTLYNYEKLLSKIAPGPPPDHAPSKEVME